jgi:DNA-binding MarR family transcriptional regulator
MADSMDPAPDAGMDGGAFVDRIQQLFPPILRYLDAEEESELIGLDCTASQMGALIALARAEHRTMGELALELGLTESAATRMVDRLVRTNLVRRERDPGDRRVVRVRLSTYGRQLVDVVLARRHEQFRRVGDRMSPGERHRLVEGLETLVRVFGELDVHATRTGPTAGADDPA